MRNNYELDLEEIENEDADVVDRIGHVISIKCDRKDIGAIFNEAKEEKTAFISTVAIHGRKDSQEENWSTY